MPIGTQTPRRFTPCWAASLDMWEKRKRKRVIQKYESGQRPMPPWLARLLLMYGKYGILPDFLKGRHSDYNEETTPPE